MLKDGMWEPFVGKSLCPSFKSFLLVLRNFLLSSVWKIEAWPLNFLKCKRLRARLQHSVTLFLFSIKHLNPPPCLLSLGLGTLFYLLPKINFRSFTGEGKGECGERNRTWVRLNCSSAAFPQLSFSPTCRPSLCVPKTPVILSFVVCILC